MSKKPDPIRALYDDWRDFPLALWRWKNFSRAEMACNGTGALQIDPESMDKLQSLRDLIGAPLVINSAYRSPSWNRKVGGAAKSQHMLGKAFDIRIAGHDPHELESAAREVGFTAIGRYHGPRYPSPFIHLDDRAAPAEWGDPWPYAEDEKPDLVKVTDPAPDPAAQVVRDLQRVFGSGNREKLGKPGTVKAKANCPA